mgnify:CR=1 FL=1
MDEKIVREIEEVVGKDGYSIDPSVLYTYGFDASIFHNTPDIVVQPVSTEQVSEIMKIAVIVLLSYLITHHGYQINNWRTWWKVALIGIAPGIVVAATNLSTAMIILGITFFMMWIASKKYWPFVLCGVAGVLVYIFAYPMAKLMSALNILQDYQLTRIFAWKDPASYSDETFQTLQGLYAIGSGGIFGKGLGESVQKFLMPEAQNDMIFTIICEELGLFGAISLILIYVFIIYRLFDIARNARDLYGSMLVIGILCHISLQVILNIGVATNTIPNTGVTLPFVSYGGTSLMLLMAEIGLALSVSRQIRLEDPMYVFRALPMAKLFFLW